MHVLGLNEKIATKFDVTERIHHTGYAPWSVIIKSYDMIIWSAYRPIGNMSPSRYMYYV